MRCLKKPKRILCPFNRQIDTLLETRNFMYMSSKIYFWAFYGYYLCFFSFVSNQCPNLCFQWVAAVLLAKPKTNVEILRNSDVLGEIDSLTLKTVAILWQSFLLHGHFMKAGSRTFVIQKQVVCSNVKTLYSLSFLPHVMCQLCSCLSHNLTTPFSTQSKRQNLRLKTFTNG